MVLKKLILAVFLILTICFSAYSQIIQTGTLSGLAKDKEGSGLPGAAVAIKSPALMLPQMTMLTNERGYFRFPALPPGVYNVTFKLAGFATLVREGIRVTVGETTIVNVELELSSIQETVVVTGQSPTVDIHKTTITASYAKEFLTSIPTQRQLLISFFSVVPGVINETYHGSTTGDNAFMIDGVNISDPMTGGLLVSYGFDVMEELSVDTGALRAEYGNVRGAVINAVTKSGGNDIHGQGSLYYRNKNLQEDNTKGTPLEGQYVGFRNEVDWSLNIGGPIIKNKLWLFVNMSYLSRAEYVSGFPWDEPQNAPVDNWRYYPYAKLSWQIDEKNKLVFSYNHQNIKRHNRNASMYRNEDSTWLQNNPTNTFNLQWTRFFGANLFINAKVAYVTHKLEFRAKNDLIGLYDSVTRFYSQSYGYDDISKRPKFQFNLDATYFVDEWAGRHEFKTGVELWYGWEILDRHYNRDPRYDLSNLIYLKNGVPDYILHREDFTRKDNNIMVGGFFQDSWSPTQRLTLNVGFRYDHQEGIVPEQGQDRTPIVFEGKTYDPRVMKSFKPLVWDTVSPRLGVAYTLTKDNKTAVKASFGRYYSSAISNLFVNVNPNGAISWRQRLNPDWTLKGDPYLFSAAAETKINPDLKVPYIDELTVGIEREIMTDTRLGLRYIKKWDRNLIEDLDMNALDIDALNRGEMIWTNYVPYTVTDPFNGQSVTFWGVKNTAITSASYITNPPGVKRNYDAVEVTLSKRYSHRWQMVASYVYAYAKNLTGLSSGASTGLFNNPNAMINAYGRDPLVSPHQFKLQGSYSGPWGINASGYFYYFTGQPYTRTIRSSDLGLNLAQGSVSINAEEKGARQRPNQVILDFRMEKVFVLPGRFGKIELMFDFFNAFNANTATSLESVSSNPALFTFGKTLALVTPRMIRLGVRYEF